MSNVSIWMGCLFSYVSLVSRSVQWLLVNMTLTLWPWPRSSFCFGWQANHCSVVGFTLCIACWSKCGALFKLECMTFATTEVFFLSSNMLVGSCNNIILLVVFCRDLSCFIWSRDASEILPKSSVSLSASVLFFLSTSFWKFEIGILVIKSSIICHCNLVSGCKHFCFCHLHMFTKSLSDSSSSCLYDINLQWFTL